MCVGGGKTPGRARRQHHAAAASAQRHAASAPASRPAASATSSAGSRRNPRSNPQGEDDVERSPTLSDLSAQSVVRGTSFPGYQLGQPARHRSHMIKFPRGADHCLAVEHASRLNPLDFAFVLRGDGTWTYGIVANKPVAADGLSIRFVLDGNGSTKTIQRKYWAKGI